MFERLRARVKTAERAIDQKIGYDFSTPDARKRAWRHFLWVDHGILRTFWTNLDEIAPGAWRSNQPSPARIRKYREMGIRTVLNLRGAKKKRSNFVFEEEACEENGLQLISISLKARELVKRRILLKLLDIFETIDKPFVMHCKSGADRAGLASALYLLHIENRSIAEAKKQLSVRYIHFRSFKTGILDHMLDAYEDDTRTGHIPIREWIRNRYDPEALMAGFQANRGTSDQP